MGAGDTCLTVIGFVTDGAKWCGCSMELCSCETVRTLTHGKQFEDKFFLSGRLILWAKKTFFYPFYCRRFSAHANYILTLKKKKKQLCRDISARSK